MHLQNYDYNPKPENLFLTRLADCVAQGFRVFSLYVLRFGFNLLSVLVDLRPKPYDIVCMPEISINIETKFIHL